MDAAARSSTDAEEARDASPDAVCAAELAGIARCRLDQAIRGLPDGAAGPAALARLALEDAAACARLDGHAADVFLLRERLAGGPSGSIPGAVAARYHAVSAAQLAGRLGVPDDGAAMLALWSDATGRRPAGEMASLAAAAQRLREGIHALSSRRPPPGPAALALRAWTAVRTAPPIARGLAAQVAGAAAGTRSALKDLPPSRRLPGVPLALGCDGRGGRLEDDAALLLAAARGWDAMRAALTAFSVAHARLAETLSGRPRRAPGRSPVSAALVRTAAEAEAFTVDDVLATGHAAFTRRAAGMLAAEMAEAGALVRLRSLRSATLYSLSAWPSA
jgi:hypothetical protein